MKQTVLILSLLIGFISANAQTENQDKNDRIEACRIAFITERLNLTSKEATVFWPIYNEFSSQLKKIRQAEKESGKTFKEKPAPTDQEADKFMLDYVAYKQQELELSKKYITEFKKVLPPVKVAKLVTLEQEFKMLLLQKLKDKGNPHH